jgi:hypothetical protein
VKKIKRLKISKKKLNLEISKDIYLSKEDNIEKNVLNLLKNKDNPRK